MGLITKRLVPLPADPTEDAVEQYEADLHFIYGPLAKIEVCPICALPFTTYPVVYWSGPGLFLAVHVGCAAYLGANLLLDAGRAEGWPPHRTGRKKRAK